jgi:hypothetical protein
LLVSIFLVSMSLSHTRKFRAPASTLPDSTQSAVASCAPEKAGFWAKSRSGLIPFFRRKYRGIRWPDVDDTLPKANVLPLRSASALMAPSFRLTKTDLNSASSLRIASRVAWPLVRLTAWTDVKPPYQTRSSFLAARPSTVAA